MTEQTMLERELPRWLEPAGVRLDNDRVPLYIEAVRDMSKDLAGRALDVVRTAHGEAVEASRSWVGDAMRKHDQGFVAEGKDALIARLAGAALIQALVSSISDEVILANLAIESARFIGLVPVIADIGEISKTELLKTAKQVRAPSEVDGSAAERVGKLPPERKSDAAAGVAVSADEVAQDVFAHAKALRALVSYVDDLKTAYSQNQAALNEEVEILWWTLLGRDAAGVSWADHSPSVRAVLAVQELDERTLRLPGPPSSGYFLGRILGDDATVPATIADLAEAAAPIATLPGAANQLLPLTSTISAYREVDGDRQLWPGLAEAKFGLQVGQESTLANCAMQLYRELGMLELLRA